MEFEDALKLLLKESSTKRSRDDLIATVFNLNGTITTLKSEIDTKELNCIEGSEQVSQKEYFGANELCLIFILKLFILFIFCKS